MTQSSTRHVPAGYRLRVEGHLDDHWSAWFGGLSLTRDSDGTTSLSGVVQDQAALHGLLVKVRDLGVTLVSVEVVEPSGTSPDRAGRSPARGREPAGGPSGGAADYQAEV